MTSRPRRVSAPSRWLATMVLALATLGCVNPTSGQRTELDAARARWQSAGLTSYRYTIARSCFCAAEVTRAVTVVVRAGAVASRTYVDTGAEVAPSLASSFPTVDGLFAELEEAVSRRPTVMTAAYDTVDGHLLLVFIDFVANVADDEISLTLTEFAAP